MKGVGDAFEGLIVGTRACEVWNLYEFEPVILGYSLDLGVRAGRFGLLGGANGSPDRISSLQGVEEDLEANRVMWKLLEISGLDFGIESERLGVIFQAGNKRIC